MANGAARSEAVMTRRKFPVSAARRVRGACHSIVALVCLCGPIAAIAQPYPSKPFRIIVPFAAGGNLDIVIRIVAQRMSESLGQQVIVDNRAGASGLVGVRVVAGAPPDGYTLLAISNTFATAPSVIPNAGYDPVKDFVGISLVARIPQLLVVNPALPVKSVKELIALGKARPRELSYGSNGTGSTLHLAAELFARDAGVKLLHVPYKGAAPALLDLIGGQIAIVFDQISTSIPYVNAGKIRALGVTAGQRSPVYPDLPTIAEAGLPGYDVITWNGIGALAGTPRDAVTRLHAEVAKALQAPEVRSRYLQQGIELAPSATPDEFREFLRSDVTKMARIAREAGIKAE
jgi:tripartite-type tricarboxylate transporter receptor subunit TctC